MKKLTDVCLIDAFTDEPFRGNPAGVVFSNELSTEEMQLIAREFNVSETAFISISSEADFNLKWFTPKVEVKLCGHATIAAIHFLHLQGIINENSSFSFKTLSGILNCSTRNAIHSLSIPVPELILFKGNENEIIEALNGKKVISPENFPFILDDGGYLYIYVSSLNNLMQLKPDFKKLFDLSLEKKGYDAFTLFTNETIEKNNHAHIRYFAPFYGIDEDPVTGSANGPLLLVLRKLGLIDENTEGKIFTFEQGDVLGRKGRVNVTFSPSKNNLSISGKAELIFKGELSF
jgi:PhzF family phenazine biosynthesis protein